MAIKFPERGYLTFAELVSRWKCEADDVRYAVTLQMIMPSMHFSERLDGLYWVHETQENGSPLILTLRRKPEDEDVFWSPDGWYYLREPRTTGPHACEFLHLCVKPFAPIFREPTKGIWYWVPRPITLSEVEERGVFMMHEVLKFEERYGGEQKLEERTEPVANQGMPDGASRENNAYRFEDLLHSAIVNGSLGQFRDGHLRDAVLNGVIAVFDMIRARTGLQLDGKDLVGQAFGTDKGKLIFSELESESGRNDQKGFLQIYEGVYTGVRNVKAHSLAHDLDEVKAAQYLITLSLLARRVDECKDR
jgi:uncharacterized protein (TIGR02391 family)